MKKENSTASQNTATPNIQTSRDTWLRAAADKLKPYFESSGYMLPDKMRFTVGFPSGGKRGPDGECFHPPASADRHYEVIIKIDKADTMEVLGILTHELVHTLLPPDVKHGKQFRDIAFKIGLTEGKMIHARPAKLLQEKLKEIADKLGPFPHATLDYSRASDRPKKSGTRLLKAECTAIGCGYNVRMIPKWAKAAALPCPMNPEHGPLHCDIPEEDGDGDEPHDHNGAAQSNNELAAADSNVPENHGDDVLPDAVIAKNHSDNALTQPQSTRGENRYAKLQQQHDA